jgi:putative nucleotidyltransferase with HDIG domain
MKEELLKLVPEFTLIKDLGLREKVINVWHRAIRAGGWSLRDLSRIPFTLLIKEVKVSFIEHVRAVTKICLETARVLKETIPEFPIINNDFLIAGALLHDIGKLIEYEDKEGKIQKSKRGRFLRHAFEGLGLSYDMGIPIEILHIIAVHSKEGEDFARSPEASILHHADFITFDPLKR